MLRQLVSRYCNHIDRARPAFQVCDWNEVVEIDRRGDARDQVQVRLRVLQPDLLFARFRFACNWAQPARLREQVELTVRNQLNDGSQGIKLPTTSNWVKESSMDAVVHFPAPQKENTEISFTIELNWPRRFKPLLDRAPDTLSVYFKRPTGHVISKIVLPPDTDAFVEPVGDPKLVEVRTGEEDGRRTATFESFTLPAHQAAGVWLELK
ncbi:hypothetical protein [Nocardia sp. NRRL S-836]|uniref:hypothetical protein n=1 Tax=Nocardia sp. NRRL S-836 TaxID=1519492 RepID=UPI0012FAEB78|nr:hypothetical protein [Nocardia sp. NRRL S-836]